MNLRELLILKAAGGHGGSGTLVEKTVTGNPVTFTTNVAKPLKSFSVPLSYTQEGSGDPYPPGGGKNKFDKDAVIRKDGFYYGSDGSLNTSAVAGYTENFISVNPNTQYVVSCNEQQENIRAVYFYTNEKTWIGRSGPVGTQIVFTTPDNCYFVQFQYYIVTNFDTWQLELGDSATSYSNYSNIRPISGVSSFTVTHNTSAIDVVFPAEPGTVYGGSLDLVSGVLTVTHQMLSTTWGAGTNPRVFTTNERRKFEFPVSCVGAGSADELTRSNVALSLWEYAQDSVHFYNNDFNSYMFLPIGTDDNTEIQIVGKLATPITIQLEPHSITAIKGNNTVWTDTTGDLTVTYLDKA